MFTVDIILGVLKKVFGSTLSFLWKYKGWVIIAIVIGALYIRGNNYKDEYTTELFAHNNTVLQYEKELTDIRLANEQALRIAQEESTANYKALVDKTSLIQEKYSERDKDIDATITKLNSSNNSLHQTIKDFTKRNIDSSSGSVSDSSNASSIQKLGGLLQTCVTEQDYFAVEADRLNNSVKTLQEWGETVIEQGKGDKNER